ncbi:MAG: AI-2E family transporter [Bacteroidota bacterium]
MAQNQFNEKLRQIILLLLIIVIVVLLVSELTIFIPGFLGGFTLYILSRTLFNKLVQKNKWKKGLTAFLFIFAFLIIIAIPVYFSIELITPKIKSLSAHQDKLIQGFQIISQKIEQSTGLSIFTNENATSIATKISAFIPQLLNTTAVMLTNMLMMFFLYYYLLTGGSKTESYLGRIIPLKSENITLLAEETKMMVIANALGIPIICIIQGLFAALGYWIFGVVDWALWGFLTGLFAFFPLVGTMIIWVPLVAYMYATGHDITAIELAFYSLIVIGNVDYVSRITLMKKMGDVHPLITVLGVIVGLNLFGFVGLIFGPLLVSYFIVLVKIYVNEFVFIKTSDQNTNAS